MPTASRSHSRLAFAALLAAGALSACVVVPVDPRTSQPYPAASREGGSVTVVTPPLPPAAPQPTLLNVRLYPANAQANAGGMLVANANGDTYPFVAGDRDRGWDYEPTFAPRNSGGYAWVVFTSRRTYGNRSVGSKDEVKQLWMMAVDANPQPGVDPSPLPFWMPGQDVTTLNMRGFWALDKDDPGG